MLGFLGLWSPALGECVPFPPGLVLWHPLDDGETGVVGATASITPNGIAFEPGRVRRAMSLGAEGSGVLLSLGDNQLDLESFTVEGWVKRLETAPPATAGEGGVILGGGPAGMVFALNREGRLILSGGGLMRVSSEASILDLEWHHVAVTRSGRGLAGVGWANASR